MTAKLPAGIVTNSETITGDIEQIDVVDVEDLARLWRAFATNGNLRLENYFWRLWGNDAIRRKLPGATVARLFMQISDDGEIIRTTPVQSPRSGRQLDQHSSRLRDLKPGAPPSFGQSLSGMGTSSQDQGLGKKRSQVAFNPSGTARSLQSVSPPDKIKTSVVPPSILKKPRESFDQEQGAKSSTKAVAPLPQSQTELGDEGDSDTSPSGRVARPPTPPKGHGETASLGKKKKTSFVAGAASTKRRPGVSRRKSSQSSTSNTSSIKSPTPPLRPVGKDELQTGNAIEGSSEDSQSTHASDLRVRTSAEPRPDVDSSNADEGHARTKRVTGKTSRSPGSDQPLVDRDFRSRFADRTSEDKEKLSAISTYPVPSKSMAPLAATSTMATGVIDFGNVAPSIGKGKGKAAGDEVVPLKQEGPSASVVLDDGNDDEQEMTPLARTKSQLIMLLERDQGQSGGKGKRAPGKQR